MREAICAQSARCTGSWQTMSKSEKEEISSDIPNIKRFGCYQDAHQFCAEFFPWYNHEHHHSGLGYLTPYEVHYGLAEKRREQRAGVLQVAYEKNPQRFVRGLPRPALLPTAAWINKPKEMPRTE